MIGALFSSLLFRALCCAADACAKCQQFSAQLRPTVAVAGAAAGAELILGIWICANYADNAEARSAEKQQQQQKQQQCEQQFGAVVWLSLIWRVVHSDLGFAPCFVAFFLLARCRLLRAAGSAISGIICSVILCHSHTHTKYLRSRN